MSTKITLSPLEIPEILEQILAYVDDDTINDSVLLTAAGPVTTAVQEQLQQTLLDIEEIGDMDAKAN
ncbi:hypothetical protein KI688_000759 [Linnemannia hyalina]|uniref:Uncharacterized protein n=1 Tax=Linnemannia hyalina TaxID=64524 RepID=A0A9P7Y601_9FUNG|nr:hypothetical protein KI688_000759 [Linnemannia hyalina]